MSAGRPDCVVHVSELTAEKRPRFLPLDGVGSHVRELGKATGLSRMGVSVREAEPGLGGVHRHYHHVEEEWAFVLAGTGVVRIGPHRIDVRYGSFVGFPPGPRPHHFVAREDAPLVVLEGGERRRDEETVVYPDLGLVLREGLLSRITDPLPAEEGDPTQCMHSGSVDSLLFQHEVDVAARREQRALHKVTGLSRQSVTWTRVSAGDRSTAYHTHDRTDEFVYVLDGRARVRVGDARFEVGPGDFLGHPAGGAPHQMEPISDLVYLMGGNIDADDVVLYPDDGVQRRSGVIEPLRSSPGSRRRRAARGERARR